MKYYSNGWQENQLQKLNHILKDKTIVNVDVSNSTLEIRFSDMSILKVSDEGQSCCEHRYMNCDDNLSFYLGAKFVSMEVKDGPLVDLSDDDSFKDTKECEFLEVTTSKGSFTVANYNEHNGYYGGFDIVAEYGE